MKFRRHLNKMEDKILKGMAIILGVIWVMVLMLFFYVLVESIRWLF